MGFSPVLEADCLDYILSEQTKSEIILTPSRTGANLKSTDKKHLQKALTITFLGMAMSLLEV